MLIFLILGFTIAFVGVVLLVISDIAKDKQNSKINKRFNKISIICFFIAIIFFIIYIFIHNDNLSKISRNETQIFMESNKILYENNFENRELLALLIDKNVKKTTIRRVEDEVLLTVYLMDNTNEIFFVDDTLLQDTWWFKYYSIEYMNK